MFDALETLDDMTVDLFAALSSHLLNQFDDSISPLEGLPENINKRYDHCCTMAKSIQVRLARSLRLMVGAWVSEASGIFYLHVPRQSQRSTHPVLAIIRCARSDTEIWQDAIDRFDGAERERRDG